MAQNRSFTAGDRSVEISLIRAQGAIDRLEADVQYLKKRVQALEKQSSDAMLGRGYLSIGLVGLASLFFFWVFLMVIVSNS